MRTGLNLLKVAVAVAVACSVSSAMAQGGKGNRGNAFGALASLRVLENEAVQKDMKLSDDQKASIKKLSDDNQPGGGGGFPSAEEMTALQKKIDDILLPPQKERLQEITLQTRGVRALMQPEVADKLKLTDDQKQKIQDALAAARGNKGGGKKGGGGFGQLTPEQEATVMDVLTADQKTQFTSMKGAKVEGLDMSTLMPRRGGKGNKGKGPDA